MKYPALLILLSACSSSPVYIEGSEVLKTKEDIYTTNSVIIDSFIRTIDNLEAVALLDHPLDTTDMDDLDSIEIVEFAKNLHLDDNYLDSGAQIRPNNSIYVMAEHNFSELGPPVKGIYELLPVLNKTQGHSGWVSTVLEFVTRHKTGSWPYSKSYTSMDDVRTDYGSIRKLGQIKYVIVVDDQVIMPPKVISKEYFETGLLVTKTTVYNLMTMKEEGVNIIISQNSDEVREMIAGIYDFDKDNLLALNDLNRNLVKNRNKNIVEIYELEN